MKASWLLSAAPGSSMSSANCWSAARSVLLTSAPTWRGQPKILREIYRVQGIPLYMALATKEDFYVQTRKNSDRPHARCQPSPLRVFNAGPGGLSLCRAWVSLPAALDTYLVVFQNGGRVQDIRLRKWIDISFQLPHPAKSEPPQTCPACKGKLPADMPAAARSCSGSERTLAVGKVRKEDTDRTGADRRLLKTF